VDSSTSPQNDNNYTTNMIFLLFCLFTTFQLYIWKILLHFQWVLGTFSLGVKRPGHEATLHSPDRSSWRGA